jgi:hypothetical protein
VLPALRLSWWDTRARVQRVAELPERTLDVAAAAGAGAAPASAAPAPAQPAPSASAAPATPQPRLALQPATERATPWKWASGGLALLWLGTLGAWWYSRRRRVPASAAVGPATPAGAAHRPASRPSAAGALAQLQQACAANDAAAARRYLLEWAAATWPESPPRGLNAIARRLDAQRFEEPIRALDRACYSGSAWDGTALAQLFAAAPKAAPAPRERSEIPDLYL